MYAGYGFHSFEIGDVDVVHHDGTYHLFHLVVPNHDYIAHAISTDGLVWRRVENALFISDPGNWDDDMLWTMHVAPDPHREGAWRMVYTGLCMRERGRIQRVGLARSRDLYRWDKVAEADYPLEADPEHYEADLSQGRHWISFRDPFLYREDDSSYLLVAARVTSGSVIRRGCVALYEEMAPDRWRACPPLFHPRRYDDVEVPNLVKLAGRYYLIGSIREDIKVHYWYADELEGPYRNFADNVLLPQGNYAARVCLDGERVLVWNFFFRGSRSSGQHLLPPPKELAVAEDGSLQLRSFSGFDERVTDRLEQETLTPFETVQGNPSAVRERDGDGWRLRTESGLELFLLRGEHADYRLGADIELGGNGKFGLVAHLDDEGNGYYLSLDLNKGVAQLRSWGRNSGGGIEEAFHYQQLQVANFLVGGAPHHIGFIAYGSYLELSLDGEVKLSLSDDRYRRGRVGVYLESCEARVGAIRLEPLYRPADEPYVSHDPADGDG